ncbi:peptidase M20 [Echinicola pacifica]|uniref:Peptidase M20 n=1 Tax=Echinicola pacifica TaxID=346377 RepID=A0A918UUI4_9BACT|nr:amidohydrolase [Echinicola pacifica]GGZ35104.1 peptidase M20 [Echinicola pacifica]
MKKAHFTSIQQLRHRLHREPELSGEEKSTARTIADFFGGLSHFKVLKSLGGHGLALIHESSTAGPTSMVRCELDGLPIAETGSPSYSSQHPGQSHSCGHDGHMAIVAGLGLQLQDSPIQKGRVVLLYQAAEETGEGAEKIINDPKYSKIKSDYAFALHNLPGYERSQIILKKGTFAAASKGIIIGLSGKTSHAAHPEEGISPSITLAKLMVGMEAIPKSLEEFSMITVVHAWMGERSFGTSPGEARLLATLRAYDNPSIQRLSHYIEKLVELLAKEAGLSYTIDYTEEFEATSNEPEAWQIVNEAAKSLKLKTSHIRNPFRWSEDFGRFSAGTKTMMFGLGAGKKQAPLHHGDYDFPDEIMKTGVDLFEKTIRSLHGGS